MERVILSKVAEQEKDLGKLKEELKSIILNEGIAWGSGLDPNNQPYKWVFDTKAFLLNPRGLYLTTKLFMDKVRKYNPDAVGGLTLASHLIASSLIYSNDSKEKIDGFIVRREQKDYGMLKVVEGPDISNKNVVIIDDGLNAAGFAQKAIDAVEALGCKVLAVIVLINFENGDNLILKRKGYAVESIFTLREFGLDIRSMPSNMELFELKWRYGNVNKTDYTAPKSSPAIEENRVYLGSDQGKMLCLDFNGNLVWEFVTDPHPFGVHQTAVIAGEKVIFSGYDGNVYALDKKDGKLIWKNKPCSDIGSSPIYDKETNLVYLGLENTTIQGTLAALDASNGSIIWEHTTNHHISSRAAVGKEIVVYGGNDHFIYGCDKITGKLLWKFRTHGENKGRLTIDGNYCYAGSFDGHLYCLDLQTGKLAWKRKLGTKLYTEPLVVDDKVFVGSFSNQLVCLDKGNGSILWNFMTNGNVQSYPVYDNGLVYFGSYDGNIYAVDAIKGELIWQFKTAGIISSSPTIYKDKLFVSSNDSYLYCFQRKNKE